MNTFFNYLIKIGLCFAFFTSDYGYAQKEKTELLEILSENKEDSTEVNALIELFKIEELQDSVKARAYLEQAWHVANKSELEEQKAILLICFGELYATSGEYELAEKVTLKAKYIFAKNNSRNGIGSSFIQVGRIELLKGNYKNALSNFLSAVDVYEEINDLSGLATAYHNIGGVHFDQGEKEKAAEYWGDGLDFGIELEDTVSIIYSLNALASIHYSKGELEKGLLLFQRSLALAKSINEIEQISFLTMNIGALFHKSEELDSAKEYYKQALIQLKQLNRPKNLALQYVNIGRLELDMGNGIEAIKYLDSAKIIANELRSPFILKHTYGGLADANKVAGNYEDAFQWLDKWYSLKDSLNGEELKLQIQDLQSKYEVEKKDREIAVLEKNEAQAISTSEQRKSLIIIIVAVSVAGFFLFLFYVTKRKASESQRRAKLEQKALRSQMNPHFIFNSLGAIQQMFMSGEKDLANDYLGDFGNLMRKILDNSGKEQISVKEEMEMLRLYLELEKGRSNGLLDYKIEVDDRIDQFGTMMSPLVIQPYVENAIWHGVLPTKVKGLVQIRLKISNNARNLICEIEDNGVGIIDQKHRKGHEPRGMKITEQRLGNKVSITRISPGTLIILSIPI